ncbi:phage tail-collar fiber domain-containing protein [Citrobacter freundii]|uniref:phage tail-collar fiber domain-containing protein n=1 Tax=Citrobacter freundii TaxID=546 RepID=UPI001EF01A44|nr:phage tail protein [Citrobacter freundii]
MSQTAITLAFEHWKAQQGATGEPVLLDEFVFANVPGLNPDTPVDRNEALPPVEQIVHRQPVTRTGVVNENGVVYSAVLGADVGDFSFNWIGLLNKASGTLAMIVHAPVQQKLKTAEGQQGNVLTRSFLIEYNGAQTETGITTPAETWQIDFTARMAGMDERQRLENVDIYGAAAFFGDGWLVGKTGNQFFVTKGTGYVAGLRTSLADNQNITVTTKPVKVWLDVCWTGALTSVWNVQNKITVAESLADYVQNGVQHYVFAVASIDVNGNITDLRPKGTLNEQQASDALKKHEQSRNHPDATTSAKGFTQLNSATDSTSEELAATSKAVKIAMDNANARLAKERNGADIPNPALFVQNIGLQETVNKADGAVQRSEVQASLDDVTAGKLLVNGSAIAVRSSYAGNGGPIDDTNDLPGNAVSFVYGGAKNSPAGNSGSILDVSGFGGGYNIQLFANYTTGEILGFRTRNGDNKTWHKWNFVYHTGNKPTPTDVGALPITGGTLRGALRFLFQDERPHANCMIANDDASGILSCAYGYYQDRFDIHFYDEKGAWESNPLSIGRNGNTTVLGNLSGRAVYEGNTRVYSPNNPQPVSFEGYATQNWVLQNFVQNIDLTAPTEFQFWDGRGYMRPTDGAAMYNFQMVGGSSNVGWIQIRYTRKLVNNTWYVIN